MIDGLIMLFHSLLLCHSDIVEVYSSDIFNQSLDSLIQSGWCLILLMQCVQYHQSVVSRGPIWFGCVCLHGIHVY